jgi:solute carrier family 25 protein 34/35
MAASQTTADAGHPTILVRKRHLLPLPSIACGATAACVAVLYSNMAETIKTRLQLDGEGVKHGSARVYRGVVDAAKQIYQHEGMRGLHSGLTAALAYQAVMNGSRVGLYAPILRGVQRLVGHRDAGAGSSATDLLLRAGAGATSGAIGASLGSPLYLVKNRLQAESPFFAARERHGYTGMADGLRKVWGREGVRGLFRGLDGAVPRVMVGSSVQLTTYDLVRHWGAAHLGLREGGHAQTLLASLASSLVTVTAMSPLDVVSTRLYQSAGRATSYTGPIDCARQTLAAEGWRAFFKGWAAQYVRLGPHTVLTFLALENLRPLFLAVDSFTEEPSAG